MHIAISSSARNNVVNVDRAVSLPVLVSDRDQIDTFLTTLSTRLKQNPYTTKLIVIEEAIKLLSEALSHQAIQITTNNKAAASAVSQPQQQSEQ